MRMAREVCVKCVEAVMKDRLLNRAMPNDKQSAVESMVNYLKENEGNSFLNKCAADVAYDSMTWTRMLTPEGEVPKSCRFRTEHAVCQEQEP